MRVRISLLNFFKTQGVMGLLYLLINATCFNSPALAQSKESSQEKTKNTNNEEFYRSLATSPKSKSKTKTYNSNGIGQKPSPSINLKPSDSSSDMDYALPIQTTVPEYRQFDFRPYFYLGYRDYAGSSATLTYSDMGYPLVAGFDLFYGIHDYHTLEFRSGYEHTDLTHNESSKLISAGSKTSHKISGIKDLYLGYRGFVDWVYLMIHWGGGYSFGYEPFKYDLQSGTQTSFLGQNTVSGFITLVMPFEIFVGGASFEYRWALDGNGKYTDVSGVENEFNIFGGGGQTLKFFADLPKIHHLNGEARFDRYASTTISTPSSLPVIFSEHRDILTLTGTIRYKLNQNFELIPGFSYRTVLNKGEILSGYSKMDDYIGMAQARFIF